MCEKCIELSKQDIPIEYFNKAGVLKMNTPVIFRKINFLKQAIKIHGIRYCYKDTEYINSKTKVDIICSEHGIFEQSPNNHLGGKGCSKCADIRLSDTKEYFIEKAISVHGTKYTYNNVKYINTRTLVSITCSKHGDFMQKPCSHLNGKSGCPICAKESYMSNLTTRGLYLLYSPTLGVYKIGITNNISKRLLKLNSKGEHFSLVKFYYLNNNEHSMKLEKYLHQYFEAKQCTDFLDTDLEGKTELFYLDENDINYIDSYIKSYCKNNNLALG